MSRRGRICQALLLALIAIAIALFVTPMTGRLIDLGNVFGLAVTSLFYAAAAFWEPILRLLKKLWRKKWGKALIIVPSAVLGLLMLYALVLSAFMTGAAVNRPHEPDAVVVLGCKVGKTGNPSMMLEYRIEKAYEYLSENPELICVASGGQGPNEALSEGQVIRDKLVEKGIDPSRILIEDRSTSTSENLEYSLLLLENEGIQAENIAIVTDGFHQLRAALMAKDMGVEAYAVSADTRFWLVPTYWVREWFALSHLFVFGR
ncbi:MAG: YdcF family protein [Oscillospiraceae bacterium]|nr:YdcF family protein [Oscillospiraceae bacterium]